MFIDVDSAKVPVGGGRALKLGGKKDVESFVDQLSLEGESKYRC